jgi:hypothetical protein
MNSKKRVFNFFLCVRICQSFYVSLSFIMAPASIEGDAPLQGSLPHVTWACPRAFRRCPLGKFPPHFIKNGSIYARNFALWHSSILGLPRKCCDPMVCNIENESSVEKLTNSLFISSISGSIQVM